MDDLKNHGLFLVNGAWGSWSKYGKCSRPCGGGNMIRTRICDNPVPSMGGLLCTGPSSQMTKCNKCRKLFTKRNKVHVKIVGLYKYKLTKRTHVLYLACDRYPPKMPCHKRYSCTLLAKTRKCNTIWKRAIPSWCSSKLSAWAQKQKIRNFCQSSCKNCKGSPS